MPEIMILNIKMIKNYRNLHGNFFLINFSMFDEFNGME
jgi:hypothetical protein